MKKKRGGMKDLVDWSYYDEVKTLEGREFVKELKNYDFPNVNFCEFPGLMNFIEEAKSPFVFINL